MNYEVYRNTTLGNTLQEVLDDLLHVYNFCCYYIQVRFEIIQNFLKIAKPNFRETSQPGTQGIRQINKQCSGHSS